MSAATPSTHDEAPSNTASAQGDTGALKERSIPESDAQNYGADENDGEQMRAPAEGDVAKAVQNKEGGGHAEQPDLAGDLERKEADHRETLEGKKEEEEEEDWTGKGKEVDLAGALGGRGVEVVLAAEE